MLIENNIIAYNNSGASEGEVQINEANGGPGGDYNIIRNNTFLTGVWFNNDSGGALHNEFNGNIISGAGNLWTIHPYASINDQTLSDYNLFVSGSCIVRNGEYYSLDSWRSAIRQDLHSLSGTPTFTGGPTPASISGYALAQTSLGKRAGILGADMGADVTKVGVGGSDESPQPPVTDEQAPRPPSSVGISVSP